MSGTSCDGVDAVVVSLSGGPIAEASCDGGGAQSIAEAGCDGRAELKLELAAQASSSLSLQPSPLVAEVLDHHHVPFAEDMQRRLLQLGQAGASELALAHVELGERFSEAALAALARANLQPSDITAVASAGLTVAHLPPGPLGPGATLSLGDGDVIAERTGCTVVSDFRARDRAAGGMGAPLVPFADACLLRTPGRVVGALNLGGIANVTVIPPVGPPLAFDTGPANMLMDGALARASRGKVLFDEGGRLGLAGQVSQSWLARALDADEFLSQPPPRSTGRERYGALFLDRHKTALSTLSLADLAATLAAYTVESVGRGLDDFVPQRPEQLIVSGGGAFNACLMEGLARRLAPTIVLDSNQALGVPVLAREALAFAVLGDATLRGVPCNVPSVTGARRAVRLGKLSFPV
ncbi:MAG: anhydro-N-acetylmuramic acid kinase [Pseudohongiellaceae bacterium]|jgi:anhydro-N-acetylmuramic acid kinase